MKANRRNFIKSLGGALALPLLESHGLTSNAAQKTRFLVVGNPFGAHPEHFFPKTFGKNFEISHTLKSLDWLKDRLTILSHTDHGMVSGHGREISFLSGLMPADSMAFPEKNVSVDQVMARHIGSQVRYSSIEAGLGGSIQMNWTANGVEKAPFTDPQKLYDHLFRNLTPEQKKARHELLSRNGSILDSVGDQFASLNRSVSKSDSDRLDQFQTSVRELENTFSDRATWIDKDKPEFDISEHFAESEVTIANRYNAIFDMIAYSFETDLTRVASIAFPTTLNYTDVGGVTRSYHSCTHNGKIADITAELLAIESFQIAQLSRCLKRLDAIPEPNADGSMLDHTIVLFGSGMGYGGTHSNLNLPIFVAGGGFKHLGHVDTRGDNGLNMPLCNLFVTLLQRFGVERDHFNTSTGSFQFAS